jgi:hypothetical protein
MASFKAKSDMRKRKAKIQKQQTFSQLKRNSFCLSSLLFREGEAGEEGSGHWI